MSIEVEDPAELGHGVARAIRDIVASNTVAQFIDVVKVGLVRAGDRKTAMSGPSTGNRLDRFRRQGRGLPARDSDFVDADEVGTQIWDHNELFCRVKHSIVEVRRILSVLNWPWCSERVCLVRGQLDGLSVGAN